GQQLQEVAQEPNVSFEVGWQLEECGAKLTGIVKRRHPLREGADGLLAIFEAPHVRDELICLADESERWGSFGNPFQRGLFAKTVAKRVIHLAGRKPRCVILQKFTLR